MSPSDFVNYSEIVLWTVLGLVFAVVAARRKPPVRARLAILALAFLAFGASDYFELQSGAWWKPWWLLLLKAACIVVFFLAFRRYQKEQKAARRAGAPPSDPDPM